MDYGCLEPLVVIAYVDIVLVRKSWKVTKIANNKANQSRNQGFEVVDHEMLDIYLSAL